tara:strand:- start:11615 stop:12700 length:1086 start_codon:yes stop_codon:yes gene_type:complete
MLYFLPIVFLIVVLIPYLLNNFFLKKNLEEMDELLKFTKDKNFFLDKKNLSKKLVFIPHPYTNWTLNPHHKSHSNEVSHTNEGFRKVNDDSSIFETIKKSKNKKKIICIGGSTTQCQEMTSYKYSWPSLLNKKLNNDKFQVFNFGVAGWGTGQSLARIIYWVPTIKPDLIIFYQAKNDLTPFANIDKSIPDIHPDTQNSVVQYAQSFFFKFPRSLLLLPIFKLLYYFFFFKKNFIHFGLLNIYKPKPEQNIEGLSRIKQYHLDSIFLRIWKIFSLTKYYNCKLLYIPEIVLDGPYKNFLNEKIYPKIKNEISIDFENVSYQDITNLLEKDATNFLDKMHFSKQGNELFSDILKKRITEIYK